MGDDQGIASAAAAFVPLAVTTRSGVIESVHHGVVVCLGPRGDVVYSAGEPSVPVYPRSSTKPLQAEAMVRHGLRLEPELLAMVCASHDGTPRHVALARAILHGAGLDTATIDELCATAHVHIGVDGCGAPAHMVSLIGLARAFATLAQARSEVYTAMTGHPETVGGTRRAVTAVMREVRGVMAKDGAEGVFAAAMPDGRAVALKVADGAGRAAAPILLAALERLGIDTAAARSPMDQVVLGHGLPVGRVRASLP